MVNAMRTSRARTRVLVQDARELVDRGRNLEAHLQDGLLALQADVFGPLDEAAQVALGLDVVADAKVARALLQQRVLGSLLGRSLGRGGSDFLGELLQGLHVSKHYGRGAERTMAENKVKKTFVRGSRLKPVWNSN
jgi:hypothetical protein